MMSSISFLNSQVYVSGQILNAPKNTHFKVIYFNNHIEYIERTAVNVSLDENGQFFAEFEWDKSGEASINVADEYSQTYLTPGDSLYITLDYDLFDSTLHYEGRGNEANNFLATQTLHYYQKRAYRHARNMDPFLYLEYVDSIQNENRVLLNSFDTTLFSNDFNGYIKNYLKYGYVDPRWMFKVDFSNRGENGRPIYKDLPDDYYAFIWAIDLDNQKAYDNPYYSNALSRYIYEVLLNPKGVHDTVEVKNEFHYERRYDFLKSTFKGKVLDFQLTKFMHHYTPKSHESEGWNALMEDYKRTCQTPEYIELIENIYLRSTKLSKGNPAPNFVLENSKGDTVSLASLKGKVVFIDFWATWCSPCLIALPQTEALAKKFKENENVIILFVNVEDKKEKWKNYIDKENVKGLHLFAAAEQSKELFKKYNFSGLPHYVLIGKNGEMIDANVIDTSLLERNIDSFSKK